MTYTTIPASCCPSPAIATDVDVFPVTTATPCTLRWLHGLLLLLLACSAPLAAQESGSGLQAEVQLGETRPYLQQTVILRLRVTHPATVTELEPPQVSARDFTLELLAGPPRTSRQSGSQQMTSDFVYALTPLTSGTLRVPPLTVRAAFEDPAQEMTRARSEPLAFTVQALPDGAGALLPLHALDVTLQYNPRQRLQVGQPFEVSVMQQAAGAGGERLSDPATLLQSTDFRIYSGQSHTSSRLVRGGSLLQGQRVDTLTLVPLRDGELRLPEIALPWWDISRGAEADSGWPGRSVRVMAASGAEPAAVAMPQQATGTPMTAGLWMLWPLLAGLLTAFMTGWWLRGRCRGGRAPAEDMPPAGPVALRRFVARRLAAWRGWRARRAQKSDAATPVTAMAHAQAALRRPMQNLGRLATHLPRPTLPGLETARLEKRLAAAADAQAVRECLLAWGSEVLRLPVHTTLAELGRTLVRAYPQVGAARVRGLLAELDASLYGGGQPLELAAWKQAFGEQLDRVGRHRPFSYRPERHTGLPELNPV